MPATERISQASAIAAGPVTGGVAVTPDDTTELESVSRALYVGTPGDLSVVMRDGQTLTFANVGVGWHPIRVKIVRVTGTSAADIVAVW